MSDIAIKIEGLSKQYRLGEVGTGTISHDLNRWWHKVRGKQDPYLKIGETNDRSTKGKSEYVWALKDIDFEVKKGEVLGIIGKNGAGKSTLLKLLSKVTAPTEGFIKANGRIASLLEVGTGFHPEMTGRENIYMNGTIMGMSKPEITSKLDEIVDFAGIERYLDTPAKRYSSGMTVRLGFAIAAHLEPEILIVDEVLAVGDIDFQKKAIGKMKSVSEGEGRTVLFVSHNMTSIRKLCNSSIVLENGKVQFKGNVNDGIEYYLADPVDLKSINSPYISIQNSQAISLESGKAQQSFTNEEDILFKVRYTIKESFQNIRFSYFIYFQETIISTIIKHPDEPISNGEYEDSFLIPKGVLLKGDWQIYISVDIPKEKIILSNFLISKFEIVNISDYYLRYPKSIKGFVDLNVNVNVNSEKL